MKPLFSIADKLLDLLFPRHCPLCGTLPTRSDAAQLCDVCALSFDAELRQRCPICRHEAPACICTPACIQNTLSTVGGRQWIAAGFYKPHERGSAANRLIYTLKNDTDDTAARVLARILSREVVKHFLSSGEDISQWLITYPPRRKSAVQDTGVDQARRLAKLCAQMTGAEYISLFSRHGDAEQKSFDARGRYENAVQSFALKHPEKCRGRCVILCDDILTTGATLSACADLLRDAGATAVFAIAVLRSQKDELLATPVSDMTWFREV